MRHYNGGSVKSRTELIYTPEASVPLDFFARPVEDVARDLIGMTVVSDRGGELTAGRIIEAEAYGGLDDPASHASFRRSGVVQAMWGSPGTVYVFRAYGMYPCLNLVTGQAGEPSAILLRAIEPLEGIETMARRLAKSSGPRLASGPGLLGRALAVSLDDNEHTLDRPPLWLQIGDRPDRVVTGPRIGISRGLDLCWRFGIPDHPALSRPFPREPESHATLPPARDLL